MDVCKNVISYAYSFVISGYGMTHETEAMGMFLIPHLFRTFKYPYPHSQDADLFEVIDIFIFE